MLSDRCLSVCAVCLSVTFVHCGQTVGRIKMTLGMQVGLGPGHIVLNGDPAIPPKGAQPPIFGQYLLRPNGCMDQDVTWYGARSRPMRLCVRWEPRSPSQKGGEVEPPIFSAHVHSDQTAGWMKLVLGTEVGLSSGDFVLDGTQPPPQTGTETCSPIFGPFLLWPNGWMDKDATWHEGRRLCVR